MKFNHITALVIAATIGILALLSFQVRWMQHSQELLEEQFNQRVNMALCNTIDKLSRDHNRCQSFRAGCSSNVGHACGQQLQHLLNSSSFDQTLSAALDLFQIDLPYQVGIYHREHLGEGQSLPPYSCTLNPLLANNSHYVQLDFADKQEFILGQMGGMIGSSVSILLFISLVFILATYHLLRQHRLSVANRDFFNHMTHEFRTPLTNIRLAGRMLQRKHHELADSPYLDIINQEGQHLMQQVEQVLQLARLEKTGYQLQRQPTELQAWLRRSVQRMQLVQRENNAEIKLQLPATAVHHAIDPFHLGNALRNLLDNALKYSQEDPQINIQLQATEQTIRLLVEDNGRGMPAAEYRRIFDKFYQSPTASVRKGFGLGLAYVKRVVELHDGQIEVSENYPTGTRFTIVLPRQTPQV